MIVRISQRSGSMLCAILLLSVVSSVWSRTDELQTPVTEKNDKIRIKSSASEESLHEVDRQDVQISNDQMCIKFLKKYLNPSLKKASPRAVIFKSCNTYAENKNLLLTDSFQFFKSRDLFTEDLNSNLLNAAYRRQIEAAKRAIRNGADVNTITNAYMPKNINPINDTLTPLMIATEAGDTRFVSYLLKIPGIEINKTNNLGRTPLISAVQSGYNSIVRLLLKHGANVNVQDNLGKTALHIAIMQRRKYLVKLLLAFGANCDLADVFDEKPIYIAAVKIPDITCIKMLLKVGAVLDVTSLGLPLLSETILSNTQLQVLEVLVKYGASVNSQDPVSKRTPLHYAAFINNLKAAEFLINKGANPELTSAYDFTPLDEAKIYRSNDVKECIMDFYETQTSNI